MTRFISHCDQVDEGLGGSRGRASNEIYGHAGHRATTGQDQDVGGPQQTPSWEGGAFPVPSVVRLQR